MRDSGVQPSYIIIFFSFFLPPSHKRRTKLSMKLGFYTHGTGHLCLVQKYLITKSQPCKHRRLPVEIKISSTYQFILFMIIIRNRGREEKKFDIFQVFATPRSPIDLPSCTRLSFSHSGMGDLTNIVPKLPQPSLRHADHNPI